MPEQPLPVVVFDGDCGFCSLSVRWARRWVRPRVIFRPWQLADLESLGVSQPACQQAVQFVGLDGAVAAGGRAVCRILGTGHGPWPLLGRIGSLPGIDVIVDSAYGVVARMRHRLPGSTPACVPEAQARATVMGVTDRGRSG
jgi:predicted DCC family thiol-disulfide oxidoreductase YuxK